jgi:hypothetical protein
MKVVFDCPSLLRGRPGNKKETILDMVGKGERKRQVGDYSFCVNKKPDGELLIFVIGNGSFTKMHAHVAASGKSKEAIHENSI